MWQTLSLLWWTPVSKSAPFFTIYLLFSPWALAFFYPNKPRFRGLPMFWEMLVHRFGAIPLWLPKFSATLAIPHSVLFIFRPRWQWLSVSVPAICSEVENPHGKSCINTNNSQSGSLLLWVVSGFCFLFFLDSSASVVFYFFHFFLQSLYLLSDGKLVHQKPLSTITKTKLYLWIKI